MSLRHRFALVAALALALVGLGLAAAVASAGLSPTGVLFGRTLLAVRDDQALQGDFEFGDAATQRMLAGIAPGRAVAGNRIWGSIVGDGATVDVATVDCLGDVIAAFGEYVHGTEVAVGVRRPADASARPTEEICAVPSNAASAGAEAASLRRSLAGKTSTVRYLAQFLQTLSRSTVSVGTAGSTRFVRATFYDRPNVSAGVNIHAFELNAVPKMLDA
ncbi:MAG: hypothetical protein ABSD82_09530 [Solirubrobacteraceae bacterium]|jgi:hypothetical protein